jgi:hypothetical protein
MPEENKPNTNTPDSTQTSTTQTTTTTTANQGLTPLQKPEKTALDALPPDIQDYIKELRKEAESTRKEKEAAKRDAEAEKLRQQGEFQKLAEKHEKRVKELEPIHDRYNALSSLVSEQLAAQVSQWPDEVKALIPGDDSPIETRIDAINKLRPLVSKLTANSFVQPLQGQGARAGNGPNPRVANPEQVRQENISATQQRLRARGTYSF